MWIEGTKGTGMIAPICEQLDSAGFEAVDVHMTDLLGGQTQIMFASLVSALPLIRQNRLRALGVTSAQRAAALPELPTISESGLKGYDASSWQGISAPAGVPREIIQKMSADVAKIVKRPDIRDKILGLGGVPVGNSPEEFGAFFKGDIDKWARVIQNANIKVE